MKSILLSSTLTLLFIFLLVSCDKKDTEKPQITELEVGHNDSVGIGEHVHLEFEVTDNEALDFYQVTIHAEEEHEHKSATEEAEHWEFDSTFTEIQGLKNFTVHHHAIEVPEDAEEGEYHFHLLVADEAGNTITTEKEIVLTLDELHADH